MNFIYTATPAVCEFMGWSLPQMPVECESLVGRKSLLTDRFHQNWQIDIFQAEAAGQLHTHIIVMEQQSHYTFIITILDNNEINSDYKLFTRHCYLCWAKQHITMLQISQEMSEGVSDDFIHAVSAMLFQAPDEVLGPHSADITYYENTDPVIAQKIALLKHELSELYALASPEAPTKETIDEFIDTWNMADGQFAQLGQSNITGDFNAFLIMNADAMYRVLDMCNLPDELHAERMAAYEATLLKGIEIGKEIIAENDVSLPEDDCDTYVH